MAKKPAKKIDILCRAVAPLSVVDPEDPRLKIEGCEGKLWVMFKYIANVSERQFLHDSPVVRNHLIGLLAEDLAQTTGVNHKKVVICGKYEQN